MQALKDNAVTTQRMLDIVINGQQEAAKDRATATAMMMGWMDTTRALQVNAKVFHSPFSSSIIIYL